MALNTAVITPAEADEILANETSWLALGDPAKEEHIKYASVYMQQKWVCDAVIWADDTTISDTLKEACAYYALASFNGVLFAKPVQTVITGGKVVEQTDKVGPLQSTTKWDKGGKNVNPLQYPDALMSFECKKSCLSVPLIRT